MARIAAAIAFALYGFLLTTPAWADVPSVYLVQNSGWMEPFFTDRTSPLKPLLRALVEASQTGRTIIAGFNQDGQIPGHHSPDVLFDGPYAAEPVANAINGLSLAVRPGGRLADADFDGALVRALDDILAGKSGIVWVLTNNKNSPNNSAEIDRNTRAFAEMVRSSPYLPFVAAYPVRMPVTGRLYTERGLIIYAIAYGDEAAAVLAKEVDAPPLRSLFTDPPFKLKHLDEAPLVFSTGLTDADGAVSDLPGGGVLLRNVPATGDASIRVSGQLRSDYYPQTITRAEVSLAWSALDGVTDPASLPADVEPRVLSNLAAGGRSGQVVLVLRTPVVARPPGLAGLFAQSKLLNGTLLLRLTNLTLTLGDDFTAKMNDIAALDQLPDVFADFQRVTAATATIPVVLAVHFSPLPLIAALCLAALLLAVLLAGALIALRPRNYSIPVDGRKQSVALRPLQSRTLPLANNRALVVTGRLFGSHRYQIVDRRKN